jgi:hypothetical protein
VLYSGAIVQRCVFHPNNITRQAFCDRATKETICAKKDPGTTAGSCNGLHLEMSESEIMTHLQPDLTASIEQLRRGFSATEPTLNSLACISLDMARIICKPSRSQISWREPRFPIPIF